MLTYQFSFCVSGAILRSTPSFSAQLSAHRCCWPYGAGQLCLATGHHSPRSLMLNTPLTVLLVLRCLGLLSDGEAGTSEMAESTLLRSSEVLIAMSADIVTGRVTWFRISTRLLLSTTRKTALVDEEEEEEKTEAVVRARSMDTSSHHPAQSCALEGHTVA